MNNEEEIKKLEEEIEHLSSQIEEKERKCRVLKLAWPKEDSVYYRLHSHASITQEHWDYLPADIFALEQGNVFKTKGEAVKEKKRRYILAKLKDYIDPKGEYIIVKNDIDGSLSVLRDCIVSKQYGRRLLLGALYFSSENIARTVIETIGEKEILSLFD